MGEVVEANFTTGDNFSETRKISTPLQIQNLSEIEEGQSYVPFYDCKKGLGFTVISKPGPFSAINQEIPGTWFGIETEIDGKQIQRFVEASDFNIIPNEEGLYSNSAFLVRAKDVSNVSLGEVKKFKK